MTPKLSILIPTTPDRVNFVQDLFHNFRDQLGQEKHINHASVIQQSGRSIFYVHEFEEVEILVFEDEREFTIGYKRNRLLDNARGEYVDFIDSDDRISDDYFKHLFEGILKGVDCCSLKGIITEDDQNPLLFEHSIKYTSYRTIADSVHGEVRYERYPNHLNCIKASIAKQFKFPEKNHGEDTDWATQIFQSGLLKTEHYIPEVIYHYLYRSKK